MEKINKRCGVYAIIIIFVSPMLFLISGILESGWVAMIALIIMALTICVMLVDIGRSITNKRYRNKYVVYATVLAGEFILLLSIANILEALNKYVHWLGIVAVSIIFLTIAVLLCDVARLIRYRSTVVSSIIYFIVFMIGLIIVTINGIYWG